jgi:DNA-binding NtrC family response regulator
MSFVRRLLLVATDHRLSQVVQTHLYKTFLLTTPVVRFEDLPHIVNRETNGLLLFLASQPEDADYITTAVREIRLQELPPRLGVLETTEFASNRRIQPLTDSVYETWCWPDHIRELNAWVKRTMTAGVPFVDPTSESIPDRIRRKLLTFTPSLSHMVEQLAIAAAHDVTVLIEGETGTGKTYLARLIHDCSTRASHRFLVVSCGALSGNLIASEFFGHVKGAFTGADAVKIGKFAAAGRGTILLDEIDTLGLEHQANLLRVIETGEFEPVGSNETQLCHARIIVATNGNLAAAVEQGTFRRDLYYRLQVITFQLPPLRDRPEDISPLVRGMVARYGTRFGKRIARIHPDALRTLEIFPWPGNIRQLENIIQQAVLTCNGNELLPGHLPTAVRDRHPAVTVSSAAANATTLIHNRETTERTVIIRALERTAYSRTRAAQLLGVSRVTLYKKMKKYGLLTKASPLVNLPGELSRSASSGMN